MTSLSPTRVVKRLTMTKDPALQRETLLEAWRECEDFFVGLQMSCDPTTRIVLDKVVFMSPGEPESPHFTFEEFITLYDKITQIDCDPAEAREATIDAAMRCTVDEWNTFYRRILLKKLQEDLPMDIITQVLQELTGLQKVL